MFRERYMHVVLLLFAVAWICGLSCSQPESRQSLHERLEVSFSGRPAQIEIGGPYVGIEMHNSSPLLNRISFFYPVANSIDVSTDYWHRDQSRVLFLGLKVGDGPKEWLGLEPFKCQLTPYSAAFESSDDDKTISVAYGFCKNEPAMVVTIDLVNNSGKTQHFELYTHLEATLRTCHTYAVKDRAWSKYDAKTSTIYVNFDESETGNAQIFVANAGELPRSFTTNAETVGLPLTEENWWNSRTDDLPGEVINREAQKRPVAAYTYGKTLASHEKMTVVQIIGSCRFGEGTEQVAYLLDNFRSEMELYEEYVLNEAFREGMLETGDTILDHSAHWAKAILATNAHYLDGEIVPMPCPAEYNFYFTHDVLLTDLAAVHFDTERVKKDLKFIVSHADSENTIPHAYYWKDDRYVTEYAGSDNWNHFWFILLSARYLRHSGDLEMLELLYPYVLRSTKLAMTNKGDDDLMWAYRPDWWDIGWSFGPRSYMTILAVRALREFVYLSTVLGESLADLPSYEVVASDMQRRLTERLWDEDLGYLINYYEDGSKDTHIYIGSLLAAHFDLIDPVKKKALVETARRKLLDERLGVYNVFPMDFHLLIDYLKFSGNEAGDPFVYGNGGIWPHGNAWYVLVLTSCGEREAALRFIRNTMTLDGITNSPNGQPAMYEYRNSNYQDSTVYGKVDKPQFMWAAGWYLYSLYNLLGVRETEWNIGFDPYLPDGQAVSRFDLSAGGKTYTVRIEGAGRYLRTIKYGAMNYPSAIIPAERPSGDLIELTLGDPASPYIASVQSILQSCSYDSRNRRLSANLKAFPGHQGEVKIISPWAPKKVSLNGEVLTKGWSADMHKGAHEVSIGFIHQSIEDTVVVQF